MSHYWCLDDPSIHEPTNDQLTGRVWHGRFVLDGVIYGKKDVLLRRDKMSQQDKMHQCHIFFIWENETFSTFTQNVKKG